MRDDEASLPEFPELPQHSDFDRKGAQRLVELEAIPFGLQGAFGESFIGPYAVHLGAPKPLIALLSTVPLLCGALLQPLALSLMTRFKSRSNLLVSLLFIQSLTWLPVIAVGFMHLTGEESGWALLVAATVYYVSGMLSGPIWNSLVGDLIEPRNRVEAFSRRNLYTGFCMFVGFIVVGVMLKFAASRNWILYGFAITFMIAAVSRFISSIMLKWHPSPEYNSSDADYFSFLQFLERSYESNFLKFVIFVAVTNFSINISAPFITVYLLRDLSLNYTDYSVAIAAGFVCQLLVMRRWGCILQDVGSRRVLMISSVGFAVTPFLWLFSAKLWWLSLISGIRGALGAGYQLSVSTFLFDAVTPAKRARCAAYSSIINNLSIVLGSLVGGLIVSVVPRVEGLGAATLQTDSSILLLFVLSGIINVTTLAFLTSFKEVREVQHRPTTSILFDLAFLRPFGAILVRVGNGEKKGESSRCS